MDDPAGKSQGHRAPRKAPHKPARPQSGGKFYALAQHVVTRVQLRNLAALALLLGILGKNCCRKLVLLFYALLRQLLLLLYLQHAAATDASHAVRSDRELHGKLRRCCIL